MGREPEWSAVRAGADHWILDIALDCRKPGKPDAKVPRYEKLEIPLYIARKVSKTTGQVNGRDYEGLRRRVLTSGAPPIQSKFSDVKDGIRSA